MYINPKDTSRRNLYKSNHSTCKYYNTRNLESGRITKFYQDSVNNMLHNSILVELNKTRLCLSLDHNNVAANIRSHWKKLFIFRTTYLQNIITNFLSCVPWSNNSTQRLKVVLKFSQKMFVIPISLCKYC